MKVLPLLLMTVALAGTPGTDLNSKNVHGGTFGRITPMVNSYLSENVRLEMAYDYGHLDRFNRKGNTQFFQTRLQLQF